ncbi:MAG: DUF1610 domain-containing protein [Alphaproteobacteria bacterium]|nr:DUF1610 domain-containing protein [Alphaproteobacteria bacterium]
MSRFLCPNCGNA